MKRIFVTIVAALSMSQVQAQWAVFDATNLVQTLATTTNTYAQLSELKRQATALATQLDTNPIQALNGLAQVQGTINMIGGNVAQLNTKLQTAFPAYTAGQEYIRDFQTQSQAVQSVALSALSAFGQVMQFQNANSVQQIQQLANLSANAQSPMAAIQAGHQIELTQLGAINTLQQLTVAQGQVLSTQIASAQSEKDSAEAINQKLWGGSIPTSTRAYVQQLKAGAAK